MKISDKSTAAIRAAVQGIIKDELANQQPLLLTAREASVLTGLSGSTLKRFRDTDKGPKYVRLDDGKRSIRYRRCDLENWIKGLD